MKGLREKAHMIIDTTKGLISEAEICCGFKKKYGTLHVVEVQEI